MMKNPIKKKLKKKKEKRVFLLQNLKMHPKVVVNKEYTSQLKKKNQVIK